jgi:2-polyprenyl-3-methyl-5-hydroxy-6-metoxy-1,4-benzoquinol methylase
MTRTRSNGGTLEFLDQPILDPRELRTCVKDVARLNRWFGGTRSVVDEVRRMVRQRGLRGKISVLDVGTGGADIPRALVRWGRSQGVSFRVVACDRHAQIAGVAAASCAGDSSIQILRADALQLPFRAGHFDFVTCSLMLHHLAEEAVITLMGKLQRLPRHALILSDLERGRLAYMGTWLGTHLVCRSQFTHHDGPVSVRRAFTLDELRAISHRAGCEDIRWFRRSFFRIVGVLEV